MEDDHLPWHTCTCEECYTERRVWLNDLSYDQRLQLLGATEQAAWTANVESKPCYKMYRKLADSIGEIFYMPSSW